MLFARMFVELDARSEATETEDAMPNAARNFDDLFEIIRTTRSMRRLKPDPVPNDLIRKILEAGACAPSGGNMQRWRFLVVRDAGAPITSVRGTSRPRRDIVRENPRPGRRGNSFCGCSTRGNISPRISMRLPVWIVPCLKGGRATRTSGSSIYPAIQNMLLAARALGLGATLTTLHLQFERESEAALGLPPDAHSYALLPIGYPMGRFGPVRRVPLAEVVFEDRWGQVCPDF
jgi:nitroreductase